MYDRFHTLQDAATKYRRCRVTQHFILSDDSPDLALTCGACGDPLNVFADDVSDGYRGNRVHYYPRDKRFVLQHYTCAWGTLLGAVATSYSLAEAGAALAKAERAMAVTA